LAPANPRARTEPRMAVQKAPSSLSPTARRGLPGRRCGPRPWRSRWPPRQSGAPLAVT
jgi:hypothetical protein